MTSQPARDREEIAARSDAAIEESRQALLDLSKDIHSHPELNYQEHYSSGALADFLQSRDFQVERGVGGLETAFRAAIPGAAGEGPTIAVLAEYDALPEIGHGCGHNLIAMAAMGAALGLAGERAGLARNRCSNWNSGGGGRRRQDTALGVRRIRRRGCHPFVPSFFQSHYDTDNRTGGGELEPGDGRLPLYLSWESCSRRRRP